MMEQAQQIFVLRSGECPICRKYLESCKPIDERTVQFTCLNCKLLWNIIHGVRRPRFIWKFLAVPAWVFLKIVQPWLPSEHHFKNRNYGILDWACAGSNLILFCGVMIWMYTIALIAMILSVFI